MITNYMYQHACPNIMKLREKIEAAQLPGFVGSAYYADRLELVIAFYTPLTVAQIVVLDGIVPTHEGQ